MATCQQIYTQDELYAIVELCLLTDDFGDIMAPEITLVTGFLLGEWQLRSKNPSTAQ